MGCRFLAAVAIFMLMAIYHPAKADDTKDEAIRNLLEAMNTMESLELSLDAMAEQIKLNSPYLLNEVQIIMARGTDEESVHEAAEFYRENDFGASRLYELFRYKLSLERIIKEVMLPIYGEHYTTEEIRQLTEFYRSDVGQKTLKLNTEISRSISSKTRDISQFALNQAKEELAYELQKKLAK